MSLVIKYQRNLSHVVIQGYKKKIFSPYWTTTHCVQLCARHIVQGLTRICISARIACYCQEGAKHRRIGQDQSLGNKQIFV